MMAAVYPAKVPKEVYTQSCQDYGSVSLPANGDVDIHDSTILVSKSSLGSNTNPDGDAQGGTTYTLYASRAQVVPTLSEQAVVTIKNLANFGSNVTLSSSEVCDTVVEAFIERHPESLISSNPTRNGTNNISNVIDENEKDKENLSGARGSQNSVTNLEKPSSSDRTTCNPLSTQPCSSQQQSCSRSSANSGLKPKRVNTLSRAENGYGLYKNGQITQAQPELTQTASSELPPEDRLNGSSAPVQDRRDALETEPNKEVNTLRDAGHCVVADDVITTESSNKSPSREVTSLPQSPSKKSERSDGKRRSAKMSRRFISFFQKNPARNVTSIEGNDPEVQTSGVRRSAKKNSLKSSKRTASIAGKLLTSVRKWRRKPQKQNKSPLRQPNQNVSLKEEESGKHTEDKSRVPIFVSPQDQVEIVEDAPEEVTGEQKKLLRESWSLIKADVEDVGVETFMGLFHTHPDSIDSFLAFKDKSVQDIEQSAVLKAHALRVMQTVDKCISRLDSLDKLASVLCQLGRRHVGYRANASLVPMIGQQFISAIQPKMGDRWSDHVQQAWAALFEVINYNLRRGMMEEKHRLADEATPSRKRK